MDKLLENNKLKVKFKDMNEYLDKLNINVNNDIKQFKNKK